MPDILDLDITALAELTRAGQLSAQEITEFYLNRIHTLNTEVNAVLEVNPQALEIAAALDASSTRGPLHGIPVLLKDNIDTGDELHTTAGAWNLRDHRASRDAPLVAALRRAGAVILGKANMTEWANFTTVGMPNGYSSRGGQVRNPWGDALDVGGSSSGSGSAVAARLTPIAIGTETSGSILSPASSNGVVGLKPTVGRISRTGVIPISSSQDTAGPLARSARDAALLLSVLSERDPEDLATVPAPPLEGTLSPESLRGARLGVGRQAWARLQDAQRAVLERSVQLLQDAGAVIVEDATLDTWDELSKSGFDVLVYEFKRDLNRYLASVRRGPRSLRDVIRENEANPERIPYGQLLLLAAEATSGTLTENVYLRARARDLELTRTRGLDAMFARLELDAWLTPGNWAAHVGAKAGYPSVCVPAGLVDNTPLGLTFTGLAWSEMRLLSLAAAFEEARGAWQLAR